MNTAVVIQAGGTGTRLWPLSTKAFPKQFAKLIDGKSLIRNTFDRLAKQYDTKNIFITTGIAFKEKILLELPELSESNLILEPKKMDTAPAIGLMTLKLKEKGYDTVISIACDHNIQNVDEFLRVLKITEEANEKYSDNLILIGMNPNYPATGFGYIEMGEPKDRFNGDIVFKVNSFKEKPDYKTAEKFINDWKYLWNASYFTFNIDWMIENYNTHYNDTFNILKNCLKIPEDSPEFLDEYSKCEAISFDYAIVEKIKNILVIPASVGWSDIGSWKDAKEIMLDEETTDNNVLLGNVISIDSKESLVYSTDNKKLIAILGLNNIVVVDTGKVILVASIDKSQDVKKLVEKIEAEYL